MRAQLLETHDVPLVDVGADGAFWNVGPDCGGLNMGGRLLSEVRSEFRHPERIRLFAIVAACLPDHLASRPWALFGDGSLVVLPAHDRHVRSRAGSTNRRPPPLAALALRVLRTAQRPTPAACTMTTTTTHGTRISGPNGSIIFLTIAPGDVPDGPPHPDARHADHSNVAPRLAAAGDGGQASPPLPRMLATAAASGIAHIHDPRWPDLRPHPRPAMPIMWRSTPPAADPQQVRGDDAAGASKRGDL